MNRYWQLGLKALAFVFVMAALAQAVPASGNPTDATPPKDPCTLLKPADIQALDANAKIGKGVFTSNAPLGASCGYTWGVRTSEWGQTALDIVVLDAAKAWPGLTEASIRQRILAEIRTGGPDAAEIPGIGEGAVFTTKPQSHDASVKAYLVKAKGVLLQVTFHGGNALAQKDKLIALLKAAAAAL